MTKSLELRPLWILSEGQVGVVEGFSSEIPDAYRIRLMEFGFHPGETVGCLLTPGLGAPHVYRVSNTVFSLDKEISGSVLIRLTETETSFV